MSNHHCLGFRKCLDHPRWHVYKHTYLGWIALPPGPYPKQIHGPTGTQGRITHAEAMKVANHQARKENQ